MEIEETKYKIGDLKSMDINLSKPFPMNFNDLELRKLTLMTGLNGTGKSVIMKLNWIFNILANYAAIAQDDVIDFEDEIEFLFNHTFDDNNFTGTIKAEFDNLSLTLVLSEGKYISFNYNSSKKLMVNSTPQYLSSDTRLISDITKYMKTKKALGISLDEFVNDETLNKLLTIYKLYDVIFMESFLQEIDDFEVSDEINETLKKFETGNLKFHKIVVDKELCTIKDVDGDNVRDLSKLSSGEQVLFVMTMASKILTN